MSPVQGVPRFRPGTPRSAVQHVDADYGCGVIRKIDRRGTSARRSQRPLGGESASLLGDWRRVRDDLPAAFAFVHRHKAELLALVSSEESDTGAILGSLTAERRV